MPDIDPAALSRRPSITITTAILSSKALNGASSSVQKPPTKLGPVMLQRFEVEPTYTQLKALISKDQWLAYKEAVSRFLQGSLNQQEFSYIVDPILESSNGDKDKLHLHNQLLVLLICNIVREPPPEPGPAPWVTQNDKPAAVLGPKAPAGDSNEARFKADVMHLPSRDRKRLKDIIHNEVGDAILIARLVEGCALITP